MKKNKFKCLFLRLFVLFLLASSCAKKAVIVTANKMQTLEKAVSEEPQIMFLHLKVTQNEPKEPIVAKVENKKLVVGQLDKPLQGIELVEGKWLISMLDAEQKLLAQEVVQDPINQHFEYLNDKGKLDNVTVVKKETDCFVRVQFDPRFHTLKCESILSKKELKLLFKVVLSK
jgi:hypothetical protein